ncbi:MULTISPECIES: hypothetical protein [Streptomyces]|uniref:Uncharacterized protein n=1 Tax=Streptomyces venezuelae (strain ATCC 10712 / CBS 650.69 / DSM 40230 / JCM 4526 / NBRC 13096 / PD 04745) TaxID=953739 RepID=F2R4V2_STRVP|nr:hypothetical protein [Streptomyces venezuelae]APE21874.1 hypothetical protein vnz_13170 [Streptomyces venezuelae]QER99269.1 hypothetical protein DEJ43_13335 [Streptomyces venezuelae ATCC 10712]CCA55973.1 hypothetical protein SVEN_2687 [Streptomyces venezuelae ATCC 10712]
MHADIHLHLHQLHAAELHREAAAHRATHLTGTTLRTQLGWKLVELGLRLATPAHRQVTLAA